VSTKTRFDVASLLNADNGIRLNNEGGAAAPGCRKQRSPQYNKGKGAELPEEHLRLSLSFDEGFHHIPWLDVYHPSKRKVLENLIVTIVYSGSDGSIHAVHRETNYQQTPIPKKGGRAYRDGSGVGGEESNMPKSFTVEYVWVNEADVDVPSGLLALFVAVLIVSLSGMVGACISSAEEGGTGPSSKGRKYKEKRSSSSLGVGGGSCQAFVISLSKDDMRTMFSGKGTRWF